MLISFKWLFLMLYPFMPNGIPPLINWTSPFPFLGFLSGILHFYSNFKRNFCLQTVEHLIRRRVLRRLIWFCTVCRCHTKRTLGLYGLSVFVVGGLALSPVDWVWLEASLVRLWFAFFIVQCTYFMTDHWCGLWFLKHWSLKLIVHSDFIPLSPN